MENEKKKIRFCGNGREAANGNIVNIEILLDKIGKTDIVEKTSRNGNKHKILYLSLKRKTDGQGNHIQDDYGNSHLVSLNDWRIDKEKEKLAAPKPETENDIPF